MNKKRYKQHIPRQNYYSQSLICGELTGAFISGFLRVSHPFSLHCHCADFLRHASFHLGLSSPPICNSRHLVMAAGWQATTVTFVFIAIKTPQCQEAPLFFLLFVFNFICI